MIMTMMMMIMIMLTESCSTVGSRSRPCIFPFKYAGAEYSACTARDSDTGQPWCATEVRSSVSCHELTFSTRWTLRAGWWVVQIAAVSLHQNI